MVSSTLSGSTEKEPIHCRQMRGEVKRPTDFSLKPILRFQSGEESGGLMADECDQR